MTKSNPFTLETVACLGRCAIGPVVTVDGEHHGRATIRKVSTILIKYQKSDASAPKTQGVKKPSS